MLTLRTSASLVGSAAGVQPARQRSNPGFDTGVSHQLTGVFPQLNSAASHAWRHKGIATRPSPTELSGDLKVDAVC